MKYSYELFGATCPDWHMHIVIELEKKTQQEKFLLALGNDNILRLIGNKIFSSKYEFLIDPALLINCVQA